MKTILALAILLFATAVARTQPAEHEPAPPVHAQTDEELEAAVVRGILANRDVSAANLRVEAKSGLVTLRGTVRSEEAKATAEKVTKSVPGVVTIKNELVIQTPRAP